MLAAGELAEAKQLLSLVELVTPRDEQQWKRLHTLCLALNDRTRAQVYTERFLETCSNCAAAHLASARNFIPNRGDWDRVRGAVAAAVSNPGSDAGFWREVAEIQSAIQNHEDACEAARKSLALDPTNLDLRELLIVSLGVLKRMKELRAECALLAQALIESGAEDPLRWARLARIAADAKAIKEAKQYIDTAIGQLPQVNYGADVELVRALLLTNQPERAKPHMENLLKEGSRNLWLWKTILETAMRGRHYEIALKAIARLKGLAYLDPEFVYQLSVMERIASRPQAGFFRRLTWSRI
jgi:tetratricopeptide (TPR) repeat protein